MALPTVTALIRQAMAENYPNLTVAQLERQCRLRKNYIQTWLDPETVVKLPPQHETVYALAGHLQVSAGDLYIAFLRDSREIDDDLAGWPTGLTTQQAEVLALLDHTPPAQRHMLLGVLRLFASGFQPSPSASITAELSAISAGASVPPQDHDTPSQGPAQHHPNAVAS